MQPEPSALPRIDVMQPGDLAEVLAIDEASFQSHRASEANLREEMTRPWSHLWVARTPSHALAAFLNLWHVADEVHVLNIATDPAWRRQGYARALMRETLEFARGRGVRLVLLEVRRSNASAIALYRTLGFATTGVRRAYYADGEDGIEMMLTFDPDTREIVPQPDEVKLP